MVRSRRRQGRAGEEAGSSVARGRGTRGSCLLGSAGGLGPDGGGSPTWYSSVAMRRHAASGGGPAEETRGGRSGEETGVEVEAETGDECTCRRLSRGGRGSEVSFPLPPVSGTRSTTPSGRG